MRTRLWALAFLLPGCVCSTPVQQLKYQCTTDADCTTGYVCFQAVCTPAALADAGADAGYCDGGPSTLTDPLNCGMCGNICPQPLHAPPACAMGLCGRGPYNAGFYDLDGLFGCEATCSATSCTLGDGGTVPITAPPVPENGVVFQTLESSASYGGATQRSSTRSNTGTLGQPTPNVADGGAQQTSSRYINVGGFSAALQSP